LGSNTVGNVTAAERDNVTALGERSTNGVLPVGTRFVEFVLTNRVVSGMNDSSADNLSFVLTPRVDPPVSILAYGSTTNGWRVGINARTNRVYVLERSTTLEAWEAVTEPAKGPDGTLSLTDTNPPLHQAFYRVSCRR
jgi:hypothetical protein